MRYSTQQDVLDFVEDNNVKFVRFAFCDIFGTQKNIAVLAGQFLQNCLSVLDGRREHLLPVLRYGFEVKFVNVRIIIRVGVHHQTFQQRFVIRLNENRHKALFETFPFGIVICRHDGVIIRH